MMVGLQGLVNNFAGKLANKLVAKKSASFDDCGRYLSVQRPSTSWKTLGQQTMSLVFSLLVQKSRSRDRSPRFGTIRANHNDYVLIDTASRSTNRRKTHKESLRGRSSPLCRAETEIPPWLVDAMIGSRGKSQCKGVSSWTTRSNRGHLDQDRWGYLWWCGPFCPSITSFNQIHWYCENNQISKPSTQTGCLVGSSAGGICHAGIEKAQEYDENVRLKLAEKMWKIPSTLTISLISRPSKNMGPMEDLLKMLQDGQSHHEEPQGQKIARNVRSSSMTPAERGNPDLLNPSRRRRIAAGSGNSFVEVNKFIKDFNQANRWCMSFWWYEQDDETNGVQSK